MKKKIFLGLIIFAIIISGCFNKSVPRSVPKIKLDVTKFDMGNIDPADGLWIKEFIISNKGDRLLKINSVATSCGCTEAEVKNKEIAPNDQTILRVTYDPAVHPGLTGNITRVIYVQSNDPTQKEIELILTGNMMSSKKNR